MSRVAIEAKRNELKDPNYAVKAVSAIDPAAPNVAELAFQWMEQNPLHKVANSEAEINEKRRVQLLQPLLNMGFSRYVPFHPHAPVPITSPVPPSLH